MSQLGRPEKLVLAVIAAAMALGTAGWLVRVLRPAASEKLTAMTLPPQGQVSTNEPAEQASVVVHVTGAVNKPGVYRLGQGSRVCDALEQAGGPALDANADALNLAAVLIDGERIDVPAKAAFAGPSSLPTKEGITGEKVIAAQPVPEASGRININTASARLLDTLPGIGPSIADRIIAYRQKNGFFRSIDELAEVPGIGQKKLEAIRDRVTVQ